LLQLKVEGCCMSLGSDVAEDDVLMLDALKKLNPEGRRYAIGIVRKLESVFPHIENTNIIQFPNQMVCRVAKRFPLR